MLQIQARSSFSSRSDRAFAESATTVGGRHYKVHSSRNGYRTCIRRCKYAPVLMPVVDLCRNARSLVLVLAQLTQQSNVILKFSFFDGCHAHHKKSGKRRAIW